MSGLLARIVAEKRALAASLPAAGGERCGPAPRPFAGAIAGGGIIAEIKRRSPSRPEGFPAAADPVVLARLYHRHGAAAISIVVDQPRFGTGPDDIAPVRAAVPLPVLAKEFVVDRRQLHQLWRAGADAVLLIARLLDDTALRELLDETAALGMTALVECHAADELARAAAAGAAVVGINSRDLDTLQVDPGRILALAGHKPPGALLVAESGLTGREQLLRLRRAGCDAFLVGTHLLGSADPGAALDELRGGGTT